MNEEKITVINEDGVEIEMDVLFTFDSDQTGKQYVLYFDAESENEEVFVSSYTADGDLFSIDDQDEWDMINEVFETFMTSVNEHDHDHDHDHDHHHHHDHDHNHDHDHHHHHDHDHED